MLTEKAYLVVKVQQSIPIRDRILVYDKQRNLAFTEIDTTPELKELLGDDYKQFWRAEVTRKQIALVKRTSERDW